MQHLYTLLIFSGSLICFHLLLIKCFPQDKIFWKKIDYLWISLGIIGIFGANYSAKSELSKAQLPWHLQSLKIVYDEYESSLESEHKYFANTQGFDYNLFDDKNQANAYIAAGNFYSIQYKKAKDLKDTILINQEYSLVDSLVFPVSNFLDTVKYEHIQISAGIVRLMLKRLKEESKIITKLNTQSKRNSFEWDLLLLSPYILAIAVAIRLTKVTAEIKEIND